MKMILLLSLFFTSFSVQAIKVIIGDKSYYVENYKISDNGQTITIKENSSLNRALVNAQCPTKKTRRKIASTGARKIKKFKQRSNPFGDLMKSLDGGYQRLDNRFKKTKKKEPYVQDFR